MLADDRFATGAVAVRAGRVLLANLRKAVRFYVAAKAALITASLVAALLALSVSVPALAGPTAPCLIAAGRLGGGRLDGLVFPSWWEIWTWLRPAWR